VLGSTKTVYQGVEIDLTPPFRRVCMHDLVEEKTGVDFRTVTDVETAKLAAVKACTDRVTCLRFRVERMCGYVCAHEGVLLCLYMMVRARVDVPAEAVTKFETVGEVVNAVFEELCEGDLVQPTFVIDHPTEVSPLAKPHRSKPGVVERFELFITGADTCLSVVSPAQLTANRRA
jgi:lysyl-tRNA synthetase class 2